MGVRGGSRTSPGGRELESDPRGNRLASRPTTLRLPCVSSHLSSCGGGLAAESSATPVREFVTRKRDGLAEMESNCAVACSAEPELNPGGGLRRCWFASDAAARGSSAWAGSAWSVSTSRTLTMRACWSSIARHVPRSCSDVSAMSDGDRDVGRSRQTCERRPRENGPRAARRQRLRASARLCKSTSAACATGSSTGRLSTIVSLAPVRRRLATRWMLAAL
jgi:hypothetical protein